MLNLTKIIKLVLIVAFVCVISGHEAWAEQCGWKFCAPPQFCNYATQTCEDPQCPAGSAWNMTMNGGKGGCCANDMSSNCTLQGKKFEAFTCECIAMTEKTIKENVRESDGYKEQLCASCKKEGKDCDSKGNCKDKVKGTNDQQSGAAVTGCSGNLGLFSGLVTAGKEIFEGLRDLIYVVAGFGIIGVAVGGFFGNMNWKWLGAIVISLVIIATTGELITAITGCESYTSKVIQDTLK